MPLTREITPYESVSKQIYRFLRLDIVSCTIHPGSTLSENEISTRYKISRQPVREAFIKLAETGLVQILPQRGTFVRKISARHVADGRFIREAIEIAVVRRVAQEAGAEDIARLGAMIEQQKRAADRNDPYEFLLLDDEFHLGLAKSVHCELAWETIENIKAGMDRVRYLTLSKESPPADLIAQHSRILETIIAGDADAAEQAMRHHLKEMIFSLTQVEERYRNWFEEDSL
ncbi:GntR family transcriptional regulator [Martelella alba]|uniref:GntR family transcriptional regulator n=1 Tax=Martelella alba TaxID=2590451 RepID=A0ABY2SR36_9HYPH|nr:GntR family transcriptional regulator [Martelella alba]TKI07795.1 GntR family transcriptional regulator [Martelella alba]